MWDLSPIFETKDMKRVPIPNIKKTTTNNNKKNTTQNIASKKKNIFG